MTRLGITTKVDNQKQVVTIPSIKVSPNINVSVRENSVYPESSDLSKYKVPESSRTTNEPVTNETEPEILNPYEGVYITPTEENVKALISKVGDLTLKIEALKIIIEMFKNNPIYVNKLLLVDDVKLASLIKCLTKGEEVTIDCEDIGSGCTCGPQTYRKVNAIYVIKDGATNNLKYDFPEVTKELKDIGINTKVVW